MKSRPSYLSKSTGSFHDDYWRKKRENHAKRGNNKKLSETVKRQLAKHEAEDYRVKAMHERREKRIKELSKNCRDFRRYLKTLKKLLDDEDVFLTYSGVANVDLGELVTNLPGIAPLNTSDKFLLVEETHTFIRKLDKLTFGKSVSKRGYVRGDFGFDLPKGETYTLSDVKQAFGVT